MTIRTITPTDAREYAIRGEDHVYDKKSAESSGKTVEKIAAALANADGGEFVVGICDESEQPDPEKRWNGRNSVEAFNQILQALYEVAPTLPMEPLFLQSTGHPG
jgi:ATP-dependent DNA helicase RecG